MVDSSRVSGSPSRQRKLAFALFSIAAFLLVVEGGARAIEAVVGDAPLRRSTGSSDTLRVAFYGGSTVIGVPLPEVGFVEQFNLLFQARYPGQSLLVDNYGAAGIPSAGVVQRLSKTLAEDVDLVVVMTGHNEFIHDRATIVDPQIAYALGGALDRLAAARLARRLLRAVGPQHRAAWQLETESVANPDIDRRLQAYAANIDSILKIAHARGIPVLLCTTASNIADWPPSKPGGAFRYQRDLELRVQDIREALRANRPAQALQQVDALLTSLPDHPMLRFLRGQALRALNRHTEAQPELLFARDHDPLPRRVLSPMNEIVRQRGDQAGVWLVDVAAEFQASMLDGTSDFTLFADNCHPTPRGSYRMASAILEGLSRTGLVQEEATGRLPDPTQILERLEFKDGSPAHLEYLARNARYCMKIPFFNYPAARRYLDQAQALAPERWDFWANRASMSLLSGQRQQGVTELEQAIQLKSSPIDPGDPSLTPYLEIALQAAGLQIHGDTIVGLPQGR